MESGRDAHRLYEQLAVAHVLGGLDETDARVFRSHLLECGTCRARVGELRAIAHDLADVERDERRTHAANKTLETTERKIDLRTDRDAASEPQRQVPSARSVRIAVVIGLVLLMGLTGWNFLLRNTVARQSVQVQQVTTAATLLELGETARIESLAEDVRAQVRYDTDDIVVAAQGLVPNGAYGLYLSDSDGTVLERRGVAASGDRLLYVLPRRAEGVTVSLTRPDPDAPALPDTATDGRLLLQAVLPAPPRSSIRSPDFAEIDD